MGLSLGSFLATIAGGVGTALGVPGSQGVLLGGLAGIRGSGDSGFNIGPPLLRGPDPRMDPGIPAGSRFIGTQQPAATPGYTNSPYIPDVIENLYNPPPAAANGS